LHKALRKGRVTDEFYAMMRARALFVAPAAPPIPLDPNPSITNIRPIGQYTIPTASVAAVLGRDDSPIVRAV
jgi:hypothetical protein